LPQLSDPIRQRKPVMPVYRAAMRITLVALALCFAACSNNDTPTDARVSVIDSPTVDAWAIDAPMHDAAVTHDAMVDASPLLDGGPPSMDITTACMHVCAAIGTCAMAQDPACVTGCASDLADCTPAQVQAVDACSTQACGDPTDPSTSPLLGCLTAVACVMG
jgi:hypothetical protein